LGVEITERILRYLKLLNAIYIDLPKSHEEDVLEVYTYYRIEELEIFAVKNGVIMAYSAYVNEDADAYIQDNFFHWFVMVPADETTKGFHTEDEFLEYIQTLGVEDPDWQTPDEAFDMFWETGCLAWIPDCE